MQCNLKFCRACSMRRQFIARNVCLSLFHTFFFVVFEDSFIVLVVFLSPKNLTLWIRLNAYQSTHQRKYQSIIPNADNIIRSIRRFSFFFVVRIFTLFLSLFSCNFLYQTQFFLSIFLFYIRLNLVAPLIRENFFFFLIQTQYHCKYFDTSTLIFIKFYSA